MRSCGKMATEEEGVGDSSANFVQNVQKSARELMKVALKSRNGTSSDGDGVTSNLSDLAALLKEKKRLNKEKLWCLIDLELRRSLSAEPIEETSFSEASTEQLQRNMKELEYEVCEKRIRYQQDLLLLQRLQESIYLADHLFKNPDPSNEDRALQRMAEEQCEVTCDVGRVRSEVVRSEGEVGRVQGERMECQARCRKLMAQMNEKRKKPYYYRGGQSSQEVVRLSDSLKQLSREACLLRYTLQSLIAASGVDWSGDQVLRDLTISLGTPLHWEV